MDSQPPVKIHSGTPGLDEVLHGGFTSGQTTVVSGGPGTGKTIIGLQFLATGDSGLYIGFEERENQLRQNATALGIDLSNITILDLSAKADRFFNDNDYTIFPSEEVEGEELIEQIVSALNATEFDRLVIDPLSELRALLPDDFQFRRNISSLFNELSDRSVTTLCTAQPADKHVESDLQFLSNTAIELQYTNDRRTLEVTKYRGSEFAAGSHTYRIHTGTGGHVYPKLVPGDHQREYDRTQLSSGLESLDRLVGGGLERGSVTVISGPSGVGKTTTGSYFLQSAAARGERALAYLFEELRADYLYRSTQLGMQLEQFTDEGTLEIKEIEALSKTPDEFAAHVQTAVEDCNVEFVMIDGTAGYRQSLRGDDSPAQLTREIHALCRYLKRMGVTVILIEEISAITGEFAPTTHQISYLADNLVFLRYLEIEGGMQKAIGVLKKRYSGFETSLRQLSIDTDGLHIGSPLSGYQGLLTGIAKPIESAHGKKINNETDYQTD